MALLVLCIRLMSVCHGLSSIFFPQSTDQVHIFKIKSSIFMLVDVLLLVCVSFSLHRSVFGKYAIVLFQLFRSVCDVFHGWVFHSCRSPEAFIALTLKWQIIKLDGKKAANVARNCDLKMNNERTKNEIQTNKKKWIESTLNIKGIMKTRNLTHKNIQ